MTTDYDEQANAYEQHAADGAYNVHYDRPAALALVGEVADTRVLVPVAGRDSTPRS